MYIHGQYINQKGETISVYIVTKQSRTEEIEIEGSDERLLWTDDPIEISSEINDTFDVLIAHSATIRLQAREYISDFFCTTCRDAIVNIYKSGECLFAGYVTPQTYSQGYNELYDEIELNCIDCLSALSYSHYKDVGASGVDYSEVKTSAANRSYYDVVSELLDGVASDVNLSGGGYEVYYDGTKGLSSDAVTTVFKDLSINDALFLEDEEDDVWQLDEVLEEMLKYLNLHIIQVGFRFYIFDWATLKSTAAITWYGLDGAAQSTTSRARCAITTDNVADTGTQLSLEEVYNRLELTCPMEEIETIVESPMDDDVSLPVFKTNMRYMREYSSEGMGKRSTNAMYAMLHNDEEETTYEKAVITDWYLRVKDNVLWTFRYDDSEDMISHFYPDGSSGGRQQSAANYMNNETSKPICALLVSIGSIKRNMAKLDNSVASSVSMDDYLVVSVNGNGLYDEDTTYPQPSDLQAAAPIATYIGGSNVNLSPGDALTNNYIVFSGKIILSRRVDYLSYPDAYAAGSGEKLKAVFLLNGGVAPSNNNSEGRYLTRLFYNARTDSLDGTAQTAMEERQGIAPYDSDEAIKEFEFNYSAVGDGTDTLSKVPVLQCMLIVGDYCAVEDESQDGSIDGISWQKYKTLEECDNDEDAYYQQSFSLGFNPAIGDYIVGNSYDIQNNIDFSMNIDAEGTAIRIPYSSTMKISGKVQFQILGPVNVVWDDITRRHKTFFRHTKWTSTSKPLLACLDNIFVRDFEINVYSDNGKVNNESTDNDVVYMSDTDERYVNKKDDLEFKICSQLTSAECSEMNVTNSIKKNTVLNSDGGDGVLSIYDTHNAVSAKAEQLYVDAYYQEYHEPKVIMEQNFEDEGTTVSMFNHYVHPAMGKEFYVQGIDRNLTEGTAKITMKEL